MHFKMTLKFLSVFILLLSNLDHSLGASHHKRGRDRDHQSSHLDQFQDHFKRTSKGDEQNGPEEGKDLSGYYI